MVVSWTTAEGTLPVPPMVNWIATRPFSVRVAGQRLVVAVADLVDVRADDAADDVLVERALDLGLGLTHRRHAGAAAAEASAGAAAVAGAGAAAAALADQAGVAEADGALAGATAAATGADQAEAADAERLADLGAGQAAPHVAVVVADRERAAVRRGEEVAALLRITPRMPALRAAISGSKLRAICGIASFGPFIA
jgi:hypothetical protein